MKIPVPRRARASPSPQRVHGDVSGERASVFEAVFRLVRRIPKGRVMTYGQIATLIENRLSPRAVGWAMHGCPKDVPWQRVVNASGACSTDRIPEFPKGLQRALLSREGIRFRPNGTLDLARYRFSPPAKARARGARMSRRTLIAAIVLVSIARIFAAEPPAKPEAQEPLLSADQVVAKYLEAIGGREKLEAIQSLRMTGKLTMGPGIEAPMVMEMKRPSSMRMEFTLQGMTAVSGFDGERGWQVVPFSGQTEAVAIPEDQADDLRNQASIDGPLVDYKQKGTKLEVVGKESVDGVLAYKLSLTSKKGETRFMYVDAARFLPLKESMRRDVQGNEVEVEIAFGDYRDVAGTKFPHTIENRVKGVPMSQKMKIEKIEVNPTLDLARFKMPEKKAAPEEKP